MKTNSHLVFLTDENGKKDAVPIRTDDGQLMKKRLLHLLYDYGDKVEVGNDLITEILADNNTKSHELKIAVQFIQESRDLLESYVDWNASEWKRKHEWSESERERYDKTAEFLLATYGYTYGY